MLLDRAFFARPAATVARELLGAILEHRVPGRALMQVRIVESEAYVGSHDRACHASRGLTGRTAVMFGQAGHAYVYLIYGMYYLLNVVTGCAGDGQAVLLRGAEPVAGVEGRLDGPGRLTRALGVTGVYNGLDVCTGAVAPGHGSLVLRAGRAPAATSIVTTRRVGVDYAGPWRDAPLRYYVAGSGGVSRPR